MTGAVIPLRRPGAPMTARRTAEPSPFLREFADTWVALGLLIAMALVAVLGLGYLWGEVMELKNDAQRLRAVEVRTGRLERDLRAHRHRADVHGGVEDRWEDER